jgi:glycosyltransferase involved in cell wall biosynthesis
MNEADVITAVSKNAVDTTVPARLRYKSHVIFNGVDHKLFRKISDAKVRDLRNRMRGGLVLLNNGRLTWQKGQVFLLDAVARLAKEGVDVNSIIIGAGPLRGRLERFARLSGISERFEILSGIEEKMMPYYYNAADLFIMPSLYEPAGLALLEALACETPALATSIGGMPEMMGPEGHYIRPKSSDDIYNGIREFIADRRQFSKAAKGIRARVVKRNDWNKIAKSYETLFESIIKS